MEWVRDQIYHFNVISFIVTVAAVTIFSKANMNKELKSISRELYEDVEELKDEIREGKK